MDQMTDQKQATTQASLHSLLASRWSPRGLDPTHVLTAGQVAALLEAARWAPSASNTQPWRFLVTHRGETGFSALFDTLVDGNRVWAANASALILVAAQTTGPDGDERPWAAYDTGQAVAQLTIQAGAEGLVVHQMGGFDPEAVRQRFALPPTLVPLTVVALGVHDPAAALPEPYAAIERAPRTRHPIEELLISDKG